MILAWVILDICCRYSHLGEVSSGDEHDGQQEGKSPAKSKLRSAKVLFGSAKKDKSKSKDGAAAAVKDHDESAQSAALAGSSADPHQPDGGSLNPFQGYSFQACFKSTTYSYNENIRSNFKETLTRRDFGLQNHNSHLEY